MSNFITATHIVGLQKLIQAITGLGTALMVVHFLNPEEQGYFYTMGSLLSSYIVFDLGLSSYVIQRSAELSSGFDVDRADSTNFIDDKHDQLMLFSYWIFKWYRNIGIIVFLILLPLGVWVLGQGTSDLFNTHWFWPWLMIVGIISLHMPSIGIFAILEGTGAIREVYILRIIHYIIGSIIAWALLANGYGLYALALPIMSTGLVCYIWYFIKYRINITIERYDKLHEITQNTLPHIKYTAGIWMANYIFLNAPVILSFLSGQIVSSGQLGLSIIVANISSAIAMSVVTANVPSIISRIQSMSNVIVRKEFINLLLSAGKFYLLGSSIIVLVTVFYSDNNLVKRLLKPTDLILLFLAFAGFNIINSFIVFFRACGNNKLILPTLLLSLIIIPLNLLIAPLGVTGVILSLCIFSLVLSIAIAVFFKL